MVVNDRRDKGALLRPPSHRRGGRWSAGCVWTSTSCTHAVPGASAGFRTQLGRQRVVYGWPWAFQDACPKGYRWPSKVPLLRVLEGVTPGLTESVSGQQATVGLHLCRRSVRHVWGKLQPLKVCSFLYTLRVRACLAVAV